RRHLPAALLIPGPQREAVPSIRMSAGPGPESAVARGGTSPVTGADGCRRCLAGGARRRERPVRWRPPRRVDAAQPATPPAKSTKRGGSVGSTRQCPRSVTLPLHEVSAQWELARDSFT